MNMINEDNIQNIRCENLRDVIARHGSAKAVGKLLGYTNGSHISQLVGVRSKRDISDACCREYEKILTLPTGFFDTPPRMLISDTKPGRRSRQCLKAAEVLPSPIMPEQVVELIHLVGQVCEMEKVQLSPQKFATLVALAMIDGAAHSNRARPEIVSSLVQLAK
jgi:hypothetical protein